MTLGARSVELTDCDIGDTQIQLLYLGGVASHMGLGEVSGVPFTLAIEGPVGDRVKPSVREGRLVQRAVEGQQRGRTAFGIPRSARTACELRFQRRSIPSRPRADLFEEWTKFVALRGRRKGLRGPLLDPTLDHDRVPQTFSQSVGRTLCHVGAFLLFVFRKPSVGTAPTLFAVRRIIRLSTRRGIATASKVNAPA